MSQTTNKKKKSFHKNEARISIVGQTAIFFLIATIITGLLSFVVLKNRSNMQVKQQRVEVADNIATEVWHGLKQYKSFQWLMEYWYNNVDTLEVSYEYDDAFNAKYSAFLDKYPNIYVADATKEQIQQLPAEAQKQFAEICYTMLLLGMNATKMSFDVEFVYALAASPDYSKGTFLLSAAGVDAVRGTNYNDAYVLGVTVDCTTQQKKNMSKAASGGGDLSTDGDYIDRYVYAMDLSNGYHIMIGVTFDLSKVLSEVDDLTMSGIVTMVLMQVILSFICLCMIYFLVLRPTERIQRNVRIYRDEPKSEKVVEDLARIKSGNEIGMLARDVSDMVVAIDQYADELKTVTAEKERISAELGVAKRIQANMLPSDFPAFPDRKDFNLYATMTPAKEVGGDFYDFFLVDEDHIALVMADVSGKGVPAALFMVISKTLIKNRTLLGGTPAQILADVNNQLCENNDSGFFVTVWFAIIQLSTGNGIAANAGHEHPVLRRVGGEYEAIKYRHSVAVATMEGIRFREHEFKLQPGDRIYVYTDGVPEATDKKEELFGEERMLRSLNSHPDASPRDLLHLVREDIDVFVDGAEQFDDITMLCFDYNGPDATEKGC